MERRAIEKQVTTVQCYKVLWIYNKYESNAIYYNAMD